MASYQVTLSSTHKKAGHGRLPNSQHVPFKPLSDNRQPSNPCVYLYIDVYRKNAERELDPECPTLKSQKSKILQKNKKIHSFY